MSTDILRTPTRTGRVDVESMTSGHAQLPRVLRSMGYTALRDGQEPPILSIMGLRDTIVILPTGTGKTACFTIPTMCLNFRTLIFSPLVALMRDQVKGLQRMGIRAAQMSSTQTDAENMLAVRDWMAGGLQMFYVAPERLRNLQFQEAMRACQPDFVVLDEAHTLSQWSDNFRPDYIKVGDFIDEYKPKVVAAFTATAPPEVELDVRRVLGLQEATKFVHYPRRKNLDLRSQDFVDIMDMSRTIRNVKGTVIVYCATIKNVERVTQQLSDIMTDVGVCMYHGQLSPEMKRTNQDLFMDDKARIMVATNAFGMGVDKSNIRGVFHYDHPGSLEALSQETGRAGRDQQYSLCLTYRSKTALNTQEFFIECGHPSRGDIEAVYKTLEMTMDTENISYLTQNDIAKQSGVSHMKLRSVISVLAGHKVIERAHNEEKIAKVRFNDDAKDSLVSPPSDRYNQWKEMIKQIGEQDATGLWEFDLNGMSEYAAISYETITKYLREWDKAEIIRYVAPFRGAPTKLVGRISMIDFPRLQIKAQDARRKLQDLLMYFSIPNEEKHSYLENYFLSGDASYPSVPNLPR